MKIVFISNFLNHHQEPICEEFYEKFGSKFIFFSTQNIPNSFLKNGYPDYSKKTYNLFYYNKENEFKKNVNDADVVIIGAAPESIIEERIKLNKLTFRYSEHMFKKHPIQILDPRRIVDIYKKHMKYKHKNLYMLCASGYLKKELLKFNCYKNKMYKWGYFINRPTKTFKDIWDLKTNNKKINIIWIGRFINWKHPETPIKIAKDLLKKNIKNFSLTMVGDGYMRQSLEYDIKFNSLENHILFKNNVKNSEVINMLEISDILLSTSDIGEGWGFSLNEAMRSGCAVISSNKVGSSPFLIKNRINGFIYNFSSYDELLELTIETIKSYNLRKKISKNAFETIEKKWNSKVASNNFISLVNLIKNGKPNNINFDEPLSHA